MFVNVITFKFGVKTVTSLTTFFISKVASCFKGGYYSFGKHSFEHFPLPSSNLNNEELINLVDEMINLKKDILNCRIDNQGKILKMKIRKTDERINQLVYELYNLSDEEIEIVEKNIGIDV